MSFFIRNDNKLAFLENNLWNMLCLLCNTTQAAENNKVLSEENKRLVWNFFKNSQLFVILRTKLDNNCYFILPKNSVKRTVCRQPRKTWETFKESRHHNLYLHFFFLSFYKSKTILGLSKFCWIHPKYFTFWIMSNTFVRIQNNLDVSKIDLTDPKLF